MSNQQNQQKNPSFRPNINEFKVDLGTEVTDQITGFKGMVTARVQYITGCNQYLVQPRVKETGDFVESCWFDEDRVLSDIFAPEPPESASPRTVRRTVRRGFGEEAPKK